MSIVQLGKRQGNTDLVNSHDAFGRMLARGDAVGDRMQAQFDASKIKWSH